MQATWAAIALMSAPELAAVATVLATVVVLVLSTLTESIGAPSVLDDTTAIFLV